MSNLIIPCRSKAIEKNLQYAARKIVRTIKIRARQVSPVMSYKFDLLHLFSELCGCFLVLWWILAPDTSIVYRDCKGKMKGGIGRNLRISGVEQYLSDVPVSRNWYKTVSKFGENSYIYIYNFL